MVYAVDFKKICLVTSTMHTIKFIQYTVSVKSSFQSSAYILVSDSEFNSR